MKPTGLGGMIEIVTTAAGIRKAVDKISEVTGIPCRCPERKEALDNPNLLINKILFKQDVQTK